LLGQYVAKDTFDLRRYVQEAHLTKASGYHDDRITPMLGALHLKRNAQMLLSRLQAELTRDDVIPRQHSDYERIGEEAGAEAHVPAAADHHDALWWAPQSTLWARSRSAQELSRKIGELLKPQQDGGVAVRVIVPSDRRASRELLQIYRDEFPRLFSSEISLLNGKLELLLIPERLVCAMYHFHLAHQAIAVPIGFMSSHPDHLSAVGVLLCGQVRANPGNFVASRDDGGAEAKQDLIGLIDRLSQSLKAAAPSNGRRPRLTLKRPTDR
jgi:hypothetical protein